MTGHDGQVTSGKPGPAATSRCASSRFVASRLAAAWAAVTS